jgi:thiol-disulfide isomerase/thioredoxin
MRLFITILIAALYLVSLTAKTCALPVDTRSISSTSFQMADGERAKLSDFRGKTVVLHFMASWCGECILEAPSLERLARAVSIDRVTVLGVAINDTPEAIAGIVRRLKIAYPIMIDSLNSLKSFFEIRGVPVTYILSSDGNLMAFRDPDTGRMTSRTVGPRQWDSDEAIKSVKEAARASNEENINSTVSERQAALPAFKRRNLQSLTEALYFVLDGQRNG